MSDTKMFSLLAILHEINGRKFQEKVDAFPEDLRNYAAIAGSVIGFENAKLNGDAPLTALEKGDEFVGRLLDIIKVDPDESFREVLESSLISALKDELRFSCFNCRRFGKCLDLDNPLIAKLSRRRTRGDDSRELREEIAREVEKALKSTPYMDTDDAYKSCKHFIHWHGATGLQKVFERYAEITVSLEKQFGIAGENTLREMNSLSTQFYKRFNEQPFVITEN